MKSVKKITTLLGLLFSFTSVSAGTMTCGTHVIDDGQPQGQPRAEIKKKCGTPKSGTYGDLYYEKNGVTYQLHFNGNDELDTITEERG
jgi:hypothetical protein